LTLSGMLMTAGKAMLFFVVVTIIGAWIFPHQLKGWISRVPIIGRYGIRSLLAFDEGNYATLAILLVALVVGLVAVYFGFHPAVGAYMAGLIIKEEYFGSAADERRVEKVARNNAHLETKRIIDNAAFSWVGPVFFVDLGAKLVFDANILLEVLPYAVVMTLGLFVFQILSAGLAARFTGGMGWHASLMIGFGMLGRAELAFVVMDIAYVQHNILNEQAFFTLMITAFFLNIAVPVTIGWWRPYYLAAESKAS
jgi:Kef-type K+ transport system membrane component KefB